MMNIFLFWWIFYTLNAPSWIWVAFGIGATVRVVLTAAEILEKLARAK
jgi:hypothetical protein